MLKNLKWPDGQANASGIKPIAYAVLKADIVEFPKIKKTATTAAEAITYDDDFKLSTGKNFITIYSTQGKGKVSFEPMGEKDCRMYNNKGTLSYPDLSDEGKACALSSLNSNMIWVIPHYVAGGEVRYCVLGAENFDASVEIKGDSGDAPGSAKGITFEITAPDSYPLPVYKGTLLLENGTLDCSTGTLTANP